MQTQANADLDRRVEKVLAGMSLEDKVGEMTQLAIDMLCVGEPYNLEEPQRIDPEKARTVLVDLKVGSILNVSGRGLSQEDWQIRLKTIQDYAVHQKSSGIPVLYGIDAIHGAGYTLDATLHPQQIGLAATWNPELVEALSEMTAYETRASFIPWTFSPVMDLERNPVWPRFWEGFGEDVYLSGRLGAAMVRGFQGEDPSSPTRIAACLKHYVGYGVPHTGKDRTQALIPERQLREYFVPPFKAAIDAGALTVMVNSGEINGIPAHASHFLLTELLREELGFEGVVVSDWQDIPYLYQRHRVAKDYKEAIKMAINAGIDMSMVPADLEFPVLLKELVLEGAVPMKRIDEAVRRILKLKFQLGLFDQPFPDAEAYPDFASEKHRSLAYEAAVESIVLAKNEGLLLPLSKKAKLLVTGPTANDLRSLNGGWTYTWQGDDPLLFPTEKANIVQAIRDKIGFNEVIYVEGSDFEDAINIDLAIQATADADIVVICLGETTYTEKPGDIDDLDLPDIQLALVRQIAATGKPVVVIMAQGRPRIIREVEQMADAILIANYPGNEGGRAIADILFGDQNPSGKLPYTYPRYANDLLTYDHRGTDLIPRDESHPAVNPQFPFGHGLSYSTFSYSKLAFSSRNLKKERVLDVKVEVRNDSQRAGKEVVQVYVSDLVASITPSVRRLRAFQKVELQPGESREINFRIEPRDLAFVGQDLRWVTEPGEFELSISGLSGSFHFEGAPLYFEE